MAKIKQIKAIVTGRVQGVWFRQSTKEVANKYNICGYANNLPDGSVEVYAVGDARGVEKLLEFLHQGPQNARVDSVTIEPFAGQQPTGFTVG